MECPKEIETILLQILSQALINIRGYSFTTGDAKRCGFEADHVHNLPGLIRSFSDSGLRHYVEIFVPEYMRQVGNDVKPFKPMWDELRTYIERYGASA